MKTVARDLKLAEFLARWESLNDELPRLAKKGQVLRLRRMGVENFSPEEQKRFDNGVTTAQAIEAFFKLKDLQARFPDHFRPEGLRLSLFTPWTSLADVQYNLAVARVIGFPADGPMLTSTARLDEFPPMRQAARNDGLLSAGEGGAPFRFLNPEVEVLFSAFADLAAPGGKVKRDHLKLSQTMVEAARTMPAGKGKPALMARAEALLNRKAWKSRLDEVILPWWLDGPAARSSGKAAG